MTRHIIAIAVIFVCSSIAWIILGTTIFTRTYSYDSSLKGRVVSIWGAPHVQRPPSALVTKVTLRKEQSTEDGKTVMRTVQDQISTTLPLEGSHIDVALDV